MDRTQIPGGVARVCRTLRAAGFGAYPVGGCVRDLLRGEIGRASCRERV